MNEERENPRPWTNQYMALVDSKPDYIISLRDRQVSEDQRALLSRKQAELAGTVAEIGCGSGQHLIARAQQDAGRLFVGFELRYKRAFKTAEKAERAGLNNVFVVQGNAQLLPDLIEPGTLDGVYVNFPDPWDKRRWRKNRIINSEFVKKLYLLLREGGFISYKSDHLAYFDEAAAMLEKMEAFRIRKITRDLHKSSYMQGNILSEFEQLFASQGLPIALLEAVKVGKKPQSAL